MHMAYFMYVFLKHCSELRDRLLINAENREVIKTNYTNTNRLGEDWRVMEVLKVVIVSINQLADSSKESADIDPLYTIPFQIISADKTISSCFLVQGLSDEPTIKARNLWS